MSRASIFAFIVWPVFLLVWIVILLLPGEGTLGPIFGILTALFGIAASLSARTREEGRHDRPSPS